MRLSRSRMAWGATRLKEIDRLVEALRPVIGNWNQVFDYVEAIKNKTDLERTDLNKYYPIDKEQDEKCPDCDGYGQIPDCCGTVTCQGCKGTGRVGVSF